ncbi:hypothetical protein NLX67_09240 [Domibacillus sp. A3M-37]|uniref:hypothetical protein n=1 Tax=Domibacillus sp. A3M-37 TaxID=2962037 RepID=UPI0020B87D87|nr:hypothetical protein [Domibacillus sp. A3M-37]MCP3762573.1 hypothetical protein [Domibacillus sp. A3M-37]
MNRKWSWMARLKARICDERGISLMEVLAVIAIMAIIAPVLTSTLVTGQKIFTKQTAETQFREDADYVTTRIMNEFYSTPFDEVTSCLDGSCVTIINSMEAAFNEVENQNKDSDSPDSYYDPIQEDKGAETETKKIFIEGRQIKIQKSGTDNDGTETLEVPSGFIENPDGKPIFRVTCTSETASSSCQSGTIELVFNLQNDRTVETMQLESRFGF